MEDSRSSVSGPLVAVVAFLFLLSIYSAAYVLCGSVGTMGPAGPTLRVYSTRVEQWLFTPAARVESLVRGRDVQTAYGH